MKIPLFYVDAFTKEAFLGNPAAVCLLENWLPDETLQAIAAEHNLSETAFVVKKDEAFQIKWFTPKIQVDLCGHATLAAAHILFKIYNFGKKPITLFSKSGVLKVSQNNEGKITLDFPAYPPQPIDIDSRIAEALGKEPVKMYKSSKYLAVYETEKDIKEIKPNFGQLMQLADKGVIITAPGINCDYVLRFFAPRAGINEDPVTGSAQCMASPYWSQRLNKQKLHSLQLSERTGEIWTEIANDRVLISGYATIYMQGTIQISIKPPDMLIPFSL
jgi:PhzF family phenazine biosynthesis protein